MIKITRKLALDLRAVIRRMFGVNNKALGPPLHFTAGPTGLVVRVQGKGTTAAVQYHAPGEYGADDICVPYACLADCEGRRDEAVTLETHDHQIVCRWQEGGVPQVRQYPAPEVGETPFPAVADRLAENSSRLLAALRDASDTANPASTRYALGNIQLQAGRVAATDCRQLFIASGFDFPWKGEVRIARTTVFASQELFTDASVRIGKSEKWLTVCTGPWTLHLAIDMEGQFPRLENQVRPVDAAKAHWRLADDDAQFLIQTVKRLPNAADDDHQPVTVDLNGCVAIRARTPPAGQPTEVILNRSRYTGDGLRFNTNRHYLTRAAELGFRDFYLFDPAAPVQCRDANRVYVWAVLSADDVIQPSPDAIRIESAAGQPAAAPDITSPQSKPRRTMVTTFPHNNGTNNNGNSGEHGNGRAAISNDADASNDRLIEQAETLKAALRDSLTKLNDLIVGLKRHRKQTKLVRSTLASLRQLQEVG